MKDVNITRRSALRSAASIAAIASVNIVPRHVLGGPGHTAPSEQITRAIIGSGNIARTHFRYPGKIVAICDVDKKRLEQGVTLCKKTGNQVQPYHDFREMIARDDVDVVSIATPPHWHALQAIAASEASKDVWCEKPMTRTIGEGQKVIEACKKNGTIFRINTWFRMYSNFYGSGVTVKEIKKVVQSGVLGWPLKVTIGKHQGFNWKIDQWSGNFNLQPQKVPEHFDYNSWLGPAPYKPYNSHRTHMTFRGYWDYDGGGLGDMGMHYIDPVQYYLGKDETSPVKVEVETEEQHPDAVKAWKKVTYTYADGCQIVLDGNNSLQNAPYIEGPKGKIYRGFKTSIPHLREKIATMPDPAPQNIDFFDCVRQRKKFALNEENGHRSTTIVNMGKIALRLNRTLLFDPKTQLFIGDDEANRLVHQPMRAPWNLDGGIE